MVPWLDVTLRVIILVGLLVSWGATIIPIFPAPTVMWALTLIYGVATGFDGGGVIYFAIISVLTLASWFTDEVFSIAGARKGGARWLSVTIAGIVGLISSLLLTPIAGILLTVATLFLAENYYQGDADKAWQATKSMLIGWGWATIARLGIGLVILILWGLWAWL